MNPRRAAVVGLIVVAVGTASACSSADRPSGAAAATPMAAGQPSTAPSLPVSDATSQAPAEPDTAHVPAGQPTLTGDAASNPACKLLDIATIEETVAAHVIEERGLTSPGAYAKTGRSCTWILDSTDIGIPGVTLQWEQPVTTWHKPLVDLYRSTVDQGLATKVAKLGDYAMIEGPDAIVIDGRQSLRVSVLVHPTPTPEDQQHALALLRLALSAAKART